MTTLTINVLSALDSVWQAIRARHPDVPAVVMTLGSGTLGARPGTETLGHFAANRWQHGDLRLPELFVSGESLRRGPADVLGTLLHEAAHGVAHTRQIADTSRQGRYHNRRFKALGEELGLALLEDSRIGWSLTHVPTGTQHTYRDQLAALSQALVAYRHAEPPRTGRRAGTNLAVALCACQRRIRVAPRTLAGAPITCGACGGEFALID